MNYEYCDGYTYTIKKGDTLYEISRSHKVPLSLLLRSNPFVDVFNLQVGDTLCIPTRQAPPKPCEMWGDCEENPERPEMPGRPERPNVPGMSEGSMRPGASGMPENSVRPGASGTPENSVRPGASGMPENSVRPGASGTPENTVRPGASGMPENTVRPDVPGTPERPEMSDGSGGTGASGTPGTLQPSETQDGDMDWERYVVRPGDTMAKVLGGNMSQLAAFGQRNGWDHVYLLPGVAYFVPEDD